MLANKIKAKHLKTSTPIVGGNDPEKASHHVAKLIGLSTNLKKVLTEELSLTDEDPILAVRVNDAWIAIHEQAAPDIILDAIATFNMVAPNRRATDGCYISTGQATSTTVAVKLWRIVLTHFP